MYPFQKVTHTKESSNFAIGLSYITRYPIWLKKSDVFYYAIGYMLVYALLKVTKKLLLLSLLLRGQRQFYTVGQKGCFRCNMETWAVVLLWGIPTFMTSQKLKILPDGRGYSYHLWKKYCSYFQW